MIRQQTILYNTYNTQKELPFSPDNEEIPPF